MPTITQENRFLKLDTPLGADVLLIRSFSCSERISGLYTVHVAVAVTPENVRAVKGSDLIGKEALISLSQLDDETRFFHGIIRRLVFTGKDNDFFHFNLEIVPWLWLLTQATDCRIYQEKKVPEIVEQILKDRGCPAFEFNLSKPHTSWDYCVQYRETFYQFIARLLEQEGMFFYFKHAEEKCTLVIADNPAVHECCPGNSQYRFEEAGAGEGAHEDMVHHWEVNEQLRPGKFTMRDHHFQIPSHELLVSEPSVIEVGDNHQLEIYDYPGEYSHLFVQPDKRLGEVQEEGNLAVRRRMLAEEAAYRVVSAASTAKSAISGFTFDLTNHFQRDYNKEYVITSVQHTATQSPDYVNNSPVEHPYKNTFHCILSETPFLPGRATPKPTVLGPQTAVVVGPKGEEIYTDKYGRVKVRFFWDRYAKGDETSSCWIRVSSPWGGKSWGGVAVPRIGQEVIVDFLEGDPDQPIITGRVYNAEQMPPYDLPKQAMVSGMKTNSTPGGGGYNEIALDDTKKKEMFRMHAQYDMSTTVEHDDTQTIHNNRTITVDGTHTETIVKDTKITVSEGNLVHTVAKGSADYTVKKDITETYLANQKTNVTNVITITAGDEIKIITGESSIHMKKDGTINISGVDITITGGKTTKIGVGNQNMTCNLQKVEVSGAAINSSAVGMHEITGALVKIN